MRQHLIFAPLVALSLTLAGCGGDTPTTAGATPTSPPSAPPTTVAPVATPSPAAPDSYKLGQRVPRPAKPVFNGTVFAYRQPVAKAAPRPAQAGYEWAAADVRVCATKDAPESNAGSASWALVYADDTIIEPSNVTYQQFLLPEYPFERVLVPGRCVRGWITFPAPKGKKPQFVEWAPRTEPRPLRWKVG